MPGFIANYKAVVHSRERREVLMAMTGGQLLVQLSSLPVTLALPSIARDFGYSVDDAAWIVIANLLVLGSTVFLGARLGDRFGHPKMFFIGAIIITVGAVGIVAAQDLTQVIVLRGLQGFGAGLIHGNGNAMLAFAFPPEERGRAYAFPITGSRIGTFIGVGFFGILLQFANWDAFAGWRLVFLTMLPIGLLVIKSCLPVVRRNDEAIVDKENPIDYLGAILLVAVSAVFILSGSHLHGGEESYTSTDALSYHLPMHGLTIRAAGGVHIRRAAGGASIRGVPALQAEVFHAGDHLQRDVPPLDDGDHDPGADHDRGGVGQVADIRYCGACCRTSPSASGCPPSPGSSTTSSTRGCCGRRVCCPSRQGSCCWPCSPGRSAVLAACRSCCSRFR